MNILYKILTFLFLPFAFLYAAFAVPVILAGFSNPTLLMYGFILFCFVVYIYCSMRFVNRVLIFKQSVKRTLKDWIKANAFVNLLVAIFMLVTCLIAIQRPDLWQQIFHQMYVQMGDQGITAGLNEGALLMTMHKVFYFYTVFASLLILHIVLSFILIKKHKAFFQIQKSSEI